MPRAKITITLFVDAEDTLSMLTFVHDLDRHISAIEMLASCSMGIAMADETTLFITSAEEDSK